MARLSRDFYLGDTVKIAQALLGRCLARRLEGELLLCRIVETEAYVGRMDKACHAYGYRRTPRTEVMFGEGGHAYIYFTYGMHHCLNFVTEPEGEPSAVLIRGLQPLQGAETMARLRFGRPLAELTSYQRKNFLNGPGKVCKALSLTREQNGLDLLGDTLFVVDSPADLGLSSPAAAPAVIHAGKRVGIDYAEEAVDFPWRFWID
ncbi:MAG: DNA-3-methyladenine glycosylase [Oscillospiraceae bacterium]